MEVLHNVQHINERIPEITNFKISDDQKLSVESKKDVEFYMQALANLYLITKQKKKNSKLLVDSDKYRSCGCKKGRRSRNSNFSGQNGKGKNENNKNNNINKNSNNKNNNDCYDDGSDSDNDEKKNNFNKEEKENDKRKKKKKVKKNRENENSEKEESDEDENINEDDANSENEVEKDINMNENTNLEREIEWMQSSEELKITQKKRKVSNIDISGESSINNENSSQRYQSYQDSHVNTSISDNTLSLTKTIEANEQKKDKENLDNSNPFTSINYYNEKEKDIDEKNPFNSNEDLYFCLEKKNTKIKLDNVLKELKLKSAQNIQYPRTNSGNPDDENISNNNTNENLQQIGGYKNRVGLNGTNSNLAHNSHNSHSIIHHYVTNVGQINKAPVKRASYNLNRKSQSFGIDRLYNTDNSPYGNNISTDFNKFYSCTSNNELLQSREYKKNCASNNNENGEYNEEEKVTYKCVGGGMNFISNPLKHVKKCVPTNNGYYGNYNCVDALKYIRNYNCTNPKQYIKNYNCTNPKQYIKNYNCTNPKQYIKNYNCIKIVKSAMSDNLCSYKIKNMKENLNCQKVSKNLQRLERNYEKFGDSYKNYINKYLTNVRRTINDKKECCTKNINCNYNFFSNNFCKLASNNCLNLSKVYSRKKSKSKPLNNKKYFSFLNECYKNHVNSIKRKIDRNKKFINNYCNACYIDCSNNAITSNELSRKSSCFDYGNIEVNSIGHINSFNEEDMGLKALYKTNSYNIVRETSNSTASYRSYANINSKNDFGYKLQNGNNCLNTGIKAFKYLKKIVPSYEFAENEIIYDEDKKIFFDLEDNTYIHVKGNLYYNTKDKLFYDIEYVQDFSYGCVKSNIENFYNFMITEKYAPCKIIMKMCSHINEFMYNLLSLRKFELYYKERQNLVEIIIK
ncbi:conserved Plasmodium protein, unknown function [Plasmodium gallinaceum]|uniref:Uncharacterized protein n=1 Tax=Plasmodium gallinaceum TaxID=5849 RepID=A0A1J1GQ80_PLAGA|nr:conserved Plasmodium protein, unknown function [Plasmodium gallinaceum]CRG93455.1 conserved Plasmodium protein, unknown function [Plasmodium gallinaceum]